MCGSSINTDDNIQVDPCSDCTIRHPVSDMTRSERREESKGKGNTLLCCSLLIGSDQNKSRVGSRIKASKHQTGKKIFFPLANMHLIVLHSSNFILSS